MNVEIDHIEGQIALTILAHDMFDHRIRIVTVAALLNSQRPERNNGHMARNISVAEQDLLDGWTVEKIIVQLAAFGAKPDSLLRESAKIEITAIAMIKKDSVS